MPSPTLRPIIILQRAFGLKDRFAEGDILSARDAEEFNIWQAARFRERLKKWVYALEDGKITEQELELKEQKIREELAQGEARKSPPAKLGTLAAETLQCAREKLGAEGAEMTQAERLERVWQLYHDPQVRQEARRRFAGRQRKAREALEALGGSFQ
jgi:hypothetical protein